MTTSAELPSDQKQDKPADRLWSRPLRLHLSVIIVLLLSAISATLIGLNYYRGRLAAIADATADMHTLSERIVDHYKILFADTTTFVTLAAATELFLSTPPSDLEAKQRFMRETLLHAPHLDAVFAGYPGGEFVQLVTLAEHRAWKRRLSAPDEAAFALLVIAADGTGRTEHWEFLDAAGQIVGQTAPAAADYDPRVRPWYRRGVNHARPITTDPYRMMTTGSTGVTVARSHLLDSKIVIGADILLETIDQFLSDQRITPNSQSIVLDSKGEIIARSRPGQVGDVDRLATTASYNRILARLRAAPAPRSDEPAIQRMADGSRDFLAVVTPIPRGEPLEGGRIISVAPMDDLTLEGDRLLRQGLLVSALLLTLGIVCAVVLSRRISRSLTLLTEQAGELQRLEFDDMRQIRSHITEVSRLGSAMGAAFGVIRVFGLYVPKELVRRIIAERQYIGRGARRQTITALFADIRGFTTISEQHTPEDVVTFLSAYFDIFSQTVREHDGEIIQFLGDSVFAMWNAPLEQEHHVELACRCTLALKARVDAFNTGQRAQGLPELVTRFGLHTGLAVVGSVGAHDRFQYTAMGDTVNVASRLEGLNKDYETTILVSAAVVREAGARFQFRPLGSAQAKGRRESIEVFELFGQTPEAPAADAGAGKQRLSLIGR